MKIPKDGLRPSPVYEAHMSDGEVVRMSFYTPAGKPIDVAAGRRAVEAIVCGVSLRRQVRGFPGDIDGVRLLHKVTVAEYRERSRLGDSLAGAGYQVSARARVARDRLALAPVRA